MFLPAQTTEVPAVKLKRRDVHVGIWMLMLAHSIIARLAHQPAAEWISTLANTNLLVVTAFIVVFHLLIDRPSTDDANTSDFLIFAGGAVLLTISGLLGIHYDVAFVIGLVALSYFSVFLKLPNAKFIGFVYAALAFNGFIAPLIFQLGKDLILIGEVYAAAFMNNLIGFEVTANGTRLSASSGMRLQLIGACSVYSNLSLAFLGYATVKAFFKKNVVFSDIYIMLGLSISLIFLNTVRLGLMTPSRAAYEFWHHGNGSLVLALIQFLLIVTVCICSIALPRRT